MNFYQSIAPYYDHIFPPAAAQVSFITSKMGGIKDKHLLEAGCGTGNLAALLVAEGARVDGIDLDEEMVKMAREKYRNLSGVAFRQGNILKISELYVTEILDGIISFGNTLVHLSGIEEVTAFFKQAWMVLKPGGKLMVQIINYDHVIDNGLPGLPTIENEAIRFERYYDVVDPGTHIDFRTVLTVKSTREVIHNTVTLFPLRRHQVEKILLSIGFEEVTFSGSFAGDLLKPHSLPLIFSAFKP